jgi:hypothetical protein
VCAWTEVDPCRYVSQVLSAAACDHDVNYLDAVADVARWIAARLSCLPRERSVRRVAGFGWRGVRQILLRVLLRPVRHSRSNPRIQEHPANRGVPLSWVTVGLDTNAVGGFLEAIAKSWSSCSSQICGVPFERVARHFVSFAARAAAAVIASANVLTSATGKS